jgi:hypothetical protein
VVHQEWHVPLRWNWILGRGLGIALTEQLQVRQTLQPRPKRADFMLGSALIIPTLYEFPAGVSQCMQWQPGSQRREYSLFTGCTAWEPFVAFLFPRLAVVACLQCVSFIDGHSSHRAHLYNTWGWANTQARKCCQVINSTTKRNQESDGPQIIFEQIYGVPEG